MHPRGLQAPPYALSMTWLWLLGPHGTQWGWSRVSPSRVSAGIANPSKCCRPQIRAPPLAPASCLQMPGDTSLLMPAPPHLGGQPPPTRCWGRNGHSTALLTVPPSDKSLGPVSCDLHLESPSLPCSANPGPAQDPGGREAVAPPACRPQGQLGRLRERRLRGELSGGGTEARVDVAGGECQVPVRWLRPERGVRQGPWERPDMKGPEGGWPAGDIIGLLLACAWGGRMNRRAVPPGGTREWETPAVPWDCGLQPLGPWCRQAWPLAEVGGGL